jgi:hypothetical protein
MSRLVTHLLVERSATHYVTACGRRSIPLTNEMPFNTGSDRLEGRRPGSLGGGIVAVDKYRFLVPDRTTRYCEKCREHYRNGAGI